MKEFILMMMLWMAAPAFSEEETEFKTLQIPAFCGNAELILKGLRERYGEEIVFMAADKNDIDDDLFFSLWINAKTTTWSFIVLNKQKNTVCVMGSGKDGRIFAQPSI